MKFLKNKFKFVILFFSYICTCRQGFVDVSSNITHYPGRLCNKAKLELPNGLQHNLDSCDPKALNPCPTPNQICSKIGDDFTCNCRQGSIQYYDGTCRQVAACESDSDCDKNAVRFLILNKKKKHTCNCKKFRSVIIIMIFEGD